jgi:fatty acid desaturase
MAGNKMRTSTTAFTLSWLLVIAVLAFMVWFLVGTWGADFKFAWKHYPVVRLLVILWFLLVTICSVVGATGLGRLFAMGMGTDAEDIKRKNYALRSKA